MTQALLSTLQPYKEKVPVPKHLNNPYFKDTKVIGFVTEKNGEKRTAIQGTCKCGKTAYFTANNAKNTISCGCKLKGLKLRSNTTRINTLKVPTTTLYNRYAARCIKKSLDFNLTLQNFSTLIQQSCHYCGEKNCGGIDRVNNDLGYLLTNCVPCCKYCNRAKHMENVESFKA